MSPESDTATVVRGAPSAPRPATTGGARASPFFHFAPGQAFGERYTIVEEVGAGGMGQVYKVLDRSLGGPVALKLIRPEAAAHTPNLERFRRETSLAREVTHTNVCRVYDLGEQDGLSYLTMEFIEGQSLEDLIQSVGHLSPRQTVTLGRQICAGLAAIHEKAIVHRDLKPGNIMVDRAGHARVMDFGMAYQHAQDRLTGAGGVMGTLPYLSPEQARGKATDARSDIYAVGLILYEMLTGRRPPGDGAPLPLALRDSGERCPPPSQLSPEVPPPLDAVVMRCLERDPERRYGSAEELGQALVRIELDMSTATFSGMGALGTGPVRTPIRRWIWRVSAGALLIVGLTVGERMCRRRPPPGERPVVAVLPLQNLSRAMDDEFIGVGIADTLITNLASLPTVTVASRPATLIYRDTIVDCRRVARELGVTYVVYGDVRRMGSVVRLSLRLVRADNSVAWEKSYDGRLEQLIELHRRVVEGLSAALQLTVTAADRTRLERMPTTSAEALADYSRARALLERPDLAGNVARAIELFKAAIARDQRFALAHAGLGLAYWQQYQETKESSWVAKAENAITEALRLEPDRPRVRLALAAVYQGTGKIPAALEELQRAAAMQPADDETHHRLARLLLETGRGEESLLAARQAVALRPQFANNQALLGYVLYRLARYREALEGYQRAEALESDNPRTLQMLGACHQQLGELDQALAYYQRGLARGPDPFSYLNVGTIHYDRGSFREAVQAYDQAVRLFPRQAPFRRNRGDAYERLGDLTRARQDWQETVRLGQADLQINPGDARTLSLVAVCQAKLGHHPDARRRIEAAVQLLPTDPDVLYREAVVYALAGQTADALEALGSAISHGVSPSRAQNDYDLRALRSLPGFQAAVIPSRSR